MKLLYHNTTPATTTSTTPLTPLSLPLPGCPELCPLSSWLQLTDSLRPEDWEAECRSPADSLSQHYSAFAGIFRTAWDQADTGTVHLDLPLLIFLPSLLTVVILFVFLLRLVGFYVSVALCHHHISGQQ